MALCQIQLVRGHEDVNGQLVGVSALRKREPISLLGSEPFARQFFKIIGFS